MAILSRNFREESGWFAGNARKNTGPLQIAYKRGAGGPSKGLHYHRETYEVWIVLAGSATYIDEFEGEVPLSAGMVVMIEPGDIHDLVDKSPDFEVLMIVDRYVQDDTVNVK